MADRTIGELPVAAEMNDDSLLVVEQQSQARSIRGELVKGYAKSALDSYVHDAGFLLDIGQTVAGEPGTAAAVENTGTAERPVLQFTIPRGEPGEVSRADMDAALQRKSNPNLLDNWYFVGGGSQKGGGQFPINQKGQTEYNIPMSQVVYTIDRWKIGGAILKVEKDYISLLMHPDSPYLGSNATQNMENFGFLSNRMVTFSVLAAGVGGFLISTANAYPGYIGFNGEEDFTLKSVSLKVPSDITYFDIVMQTTSKETPLKIKAIKLELGAQQTLAHKEGDTWVLNEIPDYRTELAKCQRYMQVITNTSAFGRFGVGLVDLREQYITDTHAYIMVPILVPLRSIPTVRADGQFSVFDGKNNVDIEGEAITFDSCTTSAVNISCKLSDAVRDTIFPYGSTLTLGGLDGISRIIFDANM